MIGGHEGVQFKGIAQNPSDNNMCPYCNPVSGEEGTPETLNPNLVTWCYGFCWILPQKHQQQQQQQQQRI